jgi:hypothetical protein
LGATYQYADKLEQQDHLLEAITNTKTKTSSISQRSYQSEYIITYDVGETQWEKILTGIFTCIFICLPQYKPSLITI